MAFGFAGLGSGGGGFVFFILFSTISVCPFSPVHYDAGRLGTMDVRGVAWSLRLGRQVRGLIATILPPVTIVDTCSIFRYVRRGH